MKASPVVVVVAAIALASLAAPVEWDHEWKMRPSLSADKVHFTVQRSRWRSNWTNSSDVPLSSFNGLSRDIFARGGEAKFEYVHDAGRLLCEGRFSLGRGSGTFRFTPDPAFVLELEKLGYQPPDDEQLFSMLMSKVSLDFARGVKDAIPEITTKQLIDMRIHGLTLEYVRETRQAGYERLGAKDYIDMRIHGVSTEFLRELKNAGYDLTSKQVTELRIHGVSSDYLRTLKSYGLQPDASSMVELRIHGVTPEYLKGLKDAGYADLSVKEITQLRIHGVRTEFIRDTKDLGYQFTPKELVDLRIHGVSSEYLRKLRASGLRNLSAAQIAKLRIHGVE